MNINNYDEDRLREKMNTYLDNHLEQSPSAWARLIGISPNTFFSFLHCQKKPQRITLVKIKNFLDKVEE